MFILESPSRNSFVKAGKHENIATIMAIYQKKNSVYFTKQKTKHKKTQMTTKNLNTPALIELRNKCVYVYNFLFI